ncbi:MAG: hypothetical protein KKD63_16720 [Proteobacteria bacterium]|nr:hypothetical protein [Desulfobulbaceae bacterium]MBU4154516.1 hypothetical protein [Pseudomonadota bacterium]MDP2105449.1 hypothetical protein [Desulfobulbaceae bacterium]
MAKSKEKKYTALHEVMENYTPNFTKAIKQHIASEANSIDFTRKGIVVAHQLAAEFEKNLSKR